MNIFNRTVLGEDTYNRSQYPVSLPEVNRSVRSWWWIARKLRGSLGSRKSHKQQLNIRQISHAHWKSNREVSKSKAMRTKSIHKLQRKISRIAGADQRNRTVIQSHSVWNPSFQIRTFLSFACKQIGGWNWTHFILSLSTYTSLSRRIYS